MIALKIVVYRLYFALITLYEESNSPSLLKALVIAICSAAVWLMDKFGLWFANNQVFVTGVTAVILCNMLFGGLVHHQRHKDFDWKKLLKKTIEMVIILLVSYFVLETVLSIAGDSPVSTAFRITVQVSTVLYPGSKILKNVYVFSRGEYPPKWIMTRIFSFNESGNLQELLKGKDNGNTLD